MTVWRAIVVNPNIVWYLDNGYVYYYSNCHRNEETLQEFEVLAEATEAGNYITNLGFEYSKVALSDEQYLLVHSVTRNSWGDKSKIRNFDEIVADNNENTEGDLGGDVNDDENTGVNDERNNVIGMVEDHLRKVVNDENN